MTATVAGWALLAGFAPSVRAQVASAKAPVVTEVGWPGFHGGGGLTGRAVGTIPDAPKLLWSAKTGGPVKSSAAVADGLVFVGSDDGNVYAFDAETGAVRWTHATGMPIEASPLIHDGTVYVGSSDGALYALDARTGALRFRYPTGDRILGGAAWASLAGTTRGIVVVGSYDHKLHAVDAATGAPRWTYTTGNYIHATPAIHEDEAVFGGCDGHLHLVALADGTSNGDIPIGAYVAGSAAIAGEDAFLGHYGNKFVRVDLEKAAVAWSYQDGSFPYFSSPAIAEDRIVFGGRDRRVHAAARATGAHLWVFQTGGRVDSSPVIAGDRVVVGSADGRLYILKLGDGKKVWSHDVGESILASPAVAGGRIYIGASDGRLYAFGKPR